MIDIFYTVVSSCFWIIKSHCCLTSCPVCTVYSFYCSETDDIKTLGKSKQEIDKSYNLMFLLMLSNKLITKVTSFLFHKLL